MAKSWYILQTYTGYESKIERTLQKLLETGDLDRNVVTDIKIPVEKTTEVRNKKPHVITTKKYPGYIMLEMDLPQFGWKTTCSTIRRIQGAAGFVGTNPSEFPHPISQEEAARMLGESGKEEEIRIGERFDIGDKVKIIEGPFATFTGTVEEIYAEKSKLRVNVQIFNRATPVEVDVLQVEKI